MQSESSVNEDWLTRFLEERPDGDVEAFEAWADEQPELDDARRAQVAQLLVRLQRATQLVGEHSAARGLWSQLFGSSAPAVASTSASQVAGLEVGQRVGRFELVEFIARGGMGQVWLAEDLELRRRVAFKVVLPERIDERSLQLFAREARAGGRLVHPGIITTLDYGTDDGWSWIAQEFVDGSLTLKSYLDQARASESLPRGYYAEVARIVAELSTALAAAHDAGVIHRDVKPANVLMAKGDRPKLTDFGLARVADDSFHSMSGNVAGTYAYMSPEQVRAKKSALDHRTDVFSLGVVLYELLTLRRPFEGDTSHQIVDRILNSDPPPAHSLRSQCPRDLALIAAKAYEKDPDRRYADANMLAADLRRFLANEPVHARPPSPWQGFAKRVKRNPTTSAAVGVGVAALVVISALLSITLGINDELEAQTTLAEDRRQEAVDRARDAVLARDAADAERRNVLRLAAHRNLDEVLREVDLLWPPYPSQLPRLRAWVDRARELVAQLPEHRASLAALEAQALARPGDAQSPQADDWVFPASVEGGAWWHEQLVALISRLEELERTNLSPEPEANGTNLWSVPKRIAFAESLAEELGPTGNTAAAWERALPLIRSAYPDLDLDAPIEGLIPLGPDPDSGLWEFAHRASGPRPARGDDGRLVYDDYTGMVLVLVPGGTFTMGAQNTDPTSPNHDPALPDGIGSVQRVTVSPFLISKFELTQGQWLRLFGTQPSYWGPGKWSTQLNADRSNATWRHPVEMVTWGEARQVLRFALELPTEAQWEYACRAGALGPYQAPREAANGFCNAADQQALAAFGESFGLPDPWLVDGFAAHAPVGTFAANAFGLHDMHGNVREWCRDGFVRDLSAFDGRTDPFVPAEEDNQRSARGGSYAVGLDKVTSASREELPLGYRNGEVGLRPVISLGS